MAVLPSATANLNLPVITRPVGACGEPSALMSAVPAEPSRSPPVSYFFFSVSFTPLPSEADFNPLRGLLSPHHRCRLCINLSLLLLLLYFLHYGDSSLVYQVIPTFFIRSFCDVTFLRGSTTAASSLPPLMEPRVILPTRDSSSSLLSRSLTQTCYR